MKLLMTYIKYSPFFSNRKLFRFSYENKLMKRTRTTARIQQQSIIEKDKNDKKKQIKIQTISTTMLDEKSKLNFTSLRKPNSENVFSAISTDVATSSKEFKSDQEMGKDIKKKEELKPNVSPGKGKLRSVVDLQMMKDELSLLEDPPVTPWEKELCSERLQYKFFDVPCEELAQKLLGKVLVRYLEDGTILKGRIVETEGYLGAIDKASHSYQNKVTPRNLPMYMPPGTIYIYMTYGMYHCFNISSQEKNAHVLIKAVEPLVGLEYMELQRNMQCKNDGREKQIVKHVTRLKQYELCNSPFKICDAFAIYQDAFDQKFAYACNNLWFERQPFVRPLSIIAVSPKDSELCNNRPKRTRYYVLGSMSVSEKNSEYEKYAYTVMA